MGMLEIVLLVCGAVIFILSFVIPVTKNELSQETRELLQDEIKKLVQAEMEQVNSRVDGAVDEAIEYAMEKTERSLERLSNEKIMAVSDYSDTVLQEIHKNHEEVMFLYDMLNDKHTSLKNTVAQVNKTVKTVEQTKKEAEDAVNSFKELTPQTTVSADQTLGQPENEAMKNQVKYPTFETINYRKAAEDATDTAAQDDGLKTYRNNEDLDSIRPARRKAAEASAKQADKPDKKEEILRLYEQGMENMQIARKMGIGVGEVRLIIDLYKKS